MHTAVSRVSSILRARRERESAERASTMSSYGDLSQAHHHQAGDDSEREHLQAGCSSNASNVSKHGSDYGFDIPQHDTRDAEKLESKGNDVRKNGAFLSSPGVRIRTPIPYGPIIELRGREVIFAISCFFFLAVCVGLVVILAAEQNKLASAKEKAAKLSTRVESLETKVAGEGLCLTKECLRTSADMIDVMDASAKPCEDFWQYACGGWLATHEIPPDKTKWDMDSDIKNNIQEHIKTFLEAPVIDNTPQSAERKVKTFYRKCTDVEEIDLLGLRSLTPIIDSFGGWAVDEGWNIADRNGLWNFQRVLSQLHFTYWSNAFFMVFLGVDDKASDKNVLQFDQGGLGLPSRDMYFNESLPTVDAYKEYMWRTAKIFGATDKSTRQFVDDTFGFERNLARLHLSGEMMMETSPLESYNNLTVRGLQKLAPRVNWLEFLNQHFPSVTRSTTVLITSRKYMSSMSQLIDDTDERILNYYMVWRLIHTHAKYLSKPFRDALHNYQMVAEGLDEPVDRWQFCIEVANDWFSMATGAMYIQNLFPRENQDEVYEMVAQIKTRLRIAMEASVWMDDYTKREAIEKLNTMGENIGCPDFLRKWTRVDEYYAHFEVTESGSFFDAILSGVSDKVWMMAENLKNGRSLSEEMAGWDVIPHVLNSFYSLMENIIVFPAGILQPPYYSRNVPKYLNYGRIGASISHEITHGFDSTGFNFDKDGNMRPWWSPDVMNRYTDKTTCYANYYSKYSVDGNYVDGNITLNENIADIEGLKLSYQAYKHAVSGDEAEMPGLGLSNDKAFFLAFAQVWCAKRTSQNMMDLIQTGRHTPEKFRVQGTLSQIPEFGEAFGCSNGSSMKVSAKHRCTLW